MNDRRIGYHQRQVAARGLAKETRHPLDAWPEES